MWMSMKKIKVHIDPRGYDEKPTGKEIGGIKTRLQKGTSPSLVALEELVQKIETGHSISPGIMGGMSAKDWQEQQLFLRPKHVCGQTEDTLSRQQRRWKE